MRIVRMTTATVKMWIGGVAVKCFRLAVLILLAIAAARAFSPGQQNVPVANLTGDWIATCGDSASAGTLAVHMTQDSSGHVSGTYTSSLGGAGLITGDVAQGKLSFTLAQTQTSCPGTYQGALTLSADSADGTFGGKDCLGVHENGVFSLKHKAAEDTKAAATIPRDKDGNVQPFTLIYEAGTPVWVSRSGSAFLAVGAQEVGDYFRLVVLVSNTSDQPFNFVPGAISINDLNQNKVLPYVPPSEIAKRIEHRAAVAAALMAFGSGMRAYSQSMVTAHTTGTLSAYDNYGSWVQGSFSATTTARVPVDHAQLAAENAQNRTALAARADQQIAKLTAGTIPGAQTILPKSYVLGTTMFRKPKTANLKAIVKRDYKSYFVSVLVPIGAERFIFLFPVELLQALPRQKQ